MNILHNEDALPRHTMELISEEYQKKQFVNAYLPAFR
jgi:hypothetical protein